MEVIKHNIHENIQLNICMFHLIHNINEYLYSERFLTYINSYYKNKILTNLDKNLLRKKYYSFHMKGSSAFVTFMKMFHSRSKMEFMSDFDCALVINPNEFSEKDFIMVRTLMILGLFNTLINFLNDEMNCLKLENELIKNGYIIDKTKKSLEIINTGMATDDMLLMSYLINSDKTNKVKISDYVISSNTIYKINVLTNITNSICSHMLISIETKTTEPIHLLDIMIPTYYSPSIKYEWMLSNSLMHVSAVCCRPQYFLANNMYSTYYYALKIENVYDYSIIDLRMMYMDQLYSSHFIDYKNSLIYNEKYIRRFKRAIYIQLYLLKNEELNEMKKIFGDYLLPNRIKFKDIILKIPEFYRILDG
jgi:hypothetical protein